MTNPNEEWRPFEPNAENVEDAYRETDAHKEWAAETMKKWNAGEFERVWAILRHSYPALKPSKERK